jgi:hypothetical protein
MKQAITARITLERRGAPGRRSGKFAIAVKESDPLSAGVSRGLTPARGFIVTAVQHQNVGV